MKPGFEPGIVREVQATVTEEMCPAFDGAVVHHVYSTWSMVHHMELAARKVLVDFLDEDEEGIGARVCVDHKSPAPVGSVVTVRAELAEVRHRVVVCRVTAWDGARLLGEGEQIQMVLKKEKLKRLFERRPASGQVRSHL
jgi:predicted thioesterase